MILRNIGRSELKTAPLALGTDNFGNTTSEEDSFRIIDRALDAGMNLIDTANTYANGESEKIIGRALKRNGRRDDVLIATKFHYPHGPDPDDRGNSRKAIMRAVEGSLQRLDIETIDLYQSHRPSFEIPIEETLGALTDLIQQGKVRYLGGTTAPAWHMVETQLTAEMKKLSTYICEQTPYNLLDRRAENEIIPVCERFQLGFICWSPMAMGMLAGRYMNENAFEPDSRASVRGGIYADRVTEKAIKFGNRFCEIAKESGHKPAQLAMLWVKDQPGVTAPIIGPRTMEHLENMLPVLEMNLADDVAAKCNALVPPGSAVANFFNSSGWMQQDVDL